MTSRRRNTVGSFDDFVFPVLPPTQPSPSAELRAKAQVSEARRTGSSPQMRSVAPRLAKTLSRGRADVSIEPSVLKQAIEEVKASGRPSDLRLTSVGKSHVARGTVIASLDEAKLEVAKRAVRESALGDNTMYLSQRMGLAEGGDEIDRAMQVNLHQADLSKSLDSVPAFMSQHDRLKKQLLRVLKDPWQMGLFKTFLQEERRAALLTLFNDMAAFKRMQKIETQEEEMKQTELKEMATSICERYMRHECIPKDFKKTLEEELLPQIPDLVSIHRTFFLTVEQKVFSLLLADCFPRYLVSSNCFRTEIENADVRETISMDQDSTGTDEVTSGTGLEETLSFTMQETYTETESEYDDFEEERNGVDLSTLFCSPDTEDYIVFRSDTTSQVDAATIPKLIQRLTDPETDDAEFQFVIILTFRYFVRPLVFIELLQLRLAQVIQPPLDLFAEEELGEWQRTKMMPILLRIAKLVKMLIDLHPMYIRHTDEFTDGIIRLIETLGMVHRTGGENLNKHLQRRILAVSSLRHERAVQFSQPPPKTKLSRAFLECHVVEDVKLQFLDALEVARQLTLLDHKLYRAIQPEELLLQNWTKESTKELYSTNVLSSIRQFCSVGMWVATEIVSIPDLEKRTAVLAKFVKVAHECWRLQNYNGAMAIVSGLQNHSVYRLSKTWEAMPSSAWTQWSALAEELKCDNNYFNLRKTLKQASPPCVPYLGMYLSELTFVANESNWAESRKKKQVNVVKMSFIAKVIRGVQTFQNTRYVLATVEMLQAYLLEVPFLSDDELYNMSLACEERQGTLAPPMSRREKKTKDKELKRSKKKKKGSKGSKLLRASSSLQSKLRQK